MLPDRLVFPAELDYLLRRSGSGDPSVDVSADVSPDVGSDVSCDVSVDASCDSSVDVRAGVTPWYIKRADP